MKINLTKLLEHTAESLNQDVRSTGYNAYIRYENSSLYSPYAFELDEDSQFDVLHINRDRAE